MAFAENQGKRTAFLLGENSWKWRLQSHVDNQSFEKYDVFIDKIIQYLASSTSKKSLVVTHESFYNSGEEIIINAQYFNKNYEFDEKARLTITVVNAATKQTKNYDLLKGSNSFSANLEGLPAGKYNFTVKELNSNTSYASHFEILDFDIEKQFVNPDVVKLKQLALQTNGKAFFEDQADDLIQQLLENKEYKSIEKNISTKTPIIDWVWLLILIAILLKTQAPALYLSIVVLLSISIYATTLAPVTWVLISEIFPNAIRGNATSFSILCLWAAYFVLVFTFPILAEKLGTYGPFALYAVICSIGFVFVKTQVKETKGKTLEQMEEVFTGH